MLNKSIKIFVSSMIFVLTMGISISAQNARFQVPVNGANVLCVFNDTNCYAQGKYHSAIDYSSTNRDILATNVGKIVKVQYDGSSAHGMGNTIIIEHKVINPQGGSETLYSMYSHLQSFIQGIYEGQNVVKGQKIGTMGNTGTGSGVHLHFEVKRSAVLHNPSGSGQYWGYMPSNATNFGYIDPIWLINSTSTAVGNDYANWEFSGNGNLEGWSLINLAAWSVNGGQLFYDPSGNDPHIKSPELYVDASVLKYIKLNMASNALDGNGKIYFKTASENDYNENKTFSFSVNNNGQFYDYKIDAYLHPKWNGKITGIRIDPANAGTSGTGADTIGWSWIRISNNQ